MQNYQDIPAAQLLRDSRLLLINNILTALSSSSGSAFPTANLQQGMPCYRVDQNKLYMLTNAADQVWSLIVDFNQLPVYANDVTGVKSVGGSTYLTVNASYDSTAGRWNRVDTTAAASIVQLAPDGSMKLYRASAGANPITTFDSVNGAVYWHARNDGDGSGLDADLLDGLNSTDFMRSVNTVWITTPDAKKRFKFDTNGRSYYASGDGTHEWKAPDGTTTNALIDASGNFTTAGDVTAFSDRKLKYDIKPIDDAVETVKKLRGVRFKYRKGRRAGLGFIAQEIREVLPELVHETTTDSRDKILSVAYGNVVAVLVEAIKELSARVDAYKDLEARIQALEAAR